MIEIIYGENIKQADLAGKSVAEVREMYQVEFSIPDRAKASLNGKLLKKELEPEAKLNDGDQLLFEEKSRRAAVLLGSLLLALVITGGLFAYAYTVASITITAGAVTSDFAAVSANATGVASYSFWGKQRGAIESGMLFDITRESTYTGDLEVSVYLSNVDELQKDYAFWMLRVELTDINGNKVDQEGATQVLSLDSPFASFICDNWTATRYVECEGGSFRAFPAVHGLTGYNPLIFCEVLQTGQ